MILSHLDFYNVCFKNVWHDDLAHTYCLLLSHRGSFEFQFGAEVSNNKKGEREKCMVATGKASTSSITHR